MNIYKSKITIALAAVAICICAYDVYEAFEATKCAPGETNTLLKNDPTSEVGGYTDCVDGYQSYKIDGKATGFSVPCNQASTGVLKSMKCLYEVATKRDFVILIAKLIISTTIVFMLIVSPFDGFTRICAMIVILMKTSYATGYNLSWKWILSTIIATIMGDFVMENLMVLFRGAWLVLKGSKSLFDFIPGPKKRGSNGKFYK